MNIVIVNTSVYYQTVAAQIMLACVIEKVHWCINSQSGAYQRPFRMQALGGL